MTISSFDRVENRTEENAGPPFQTLSFFWSLKQGTDYFKYKNMYK